MSNIDLSRLITVQAKTAEQEATVLALRKSDCRTQILAVISSTAQLNLAAAAASGILNLEQMASYRTALGWIAAMREACTTGNWPPVPADIVTLAKQF